MQYFLAVAHAGTITVTKTEDTNDGLCNTDCSLREAIAAAAAGDTIYIPAGTYTLTFGLELAIDKDLTLSGASAPTTIIEAATSPGTANIRVLSISSGATVAISGVTIRHGNTDSSNTFAGAGAGIHNEGSLTLSDSTISGNSSTFKGAGIRNTGTLTVTGSTFVDNAAFEGGGINNGGAATIVNSTFSGNSATNSGGAINNIGSSATTAVVNVTISGNAGSSRAGGIFNIFGSVSLTNSIIANSLAGDDCFGGMTSLGHNIDTDGTCNLTGAGDMPGVDPLLGPLQNNGGQTLTFAPLEGSPATDNADATACPSTDQRGTARPQGNGCAIGAVEVAPTVPVPGLSELALIALAVVMALQVYFMARRRRPEPARG